MSVYVNLDIGANSSANGCPNGGSDTATIPASPFHPVRVQGSSVPVICVCCACYTEEQICIYIYIYIYIYIHIHTHVYIHTSIHTYYNENICS